jgi:hypothetical protein
MPIKNVPISNQSLQQVLFKKSLGSPFVLYPTVAAVLGTMAGALFGFTGIIASMAVGGVIAAAGGFTTEFAFRRDKNMKRIVTEITKRMEERRQALVNDLKQEIANLKITSAEKQLNDFQLKFTTFVDVLDDRFLPTELTFMRYMNVAEQVYLSGMDNLRNAVISHKAISASDIADLRSRMSNLESSPNNDKERAVLVERIHSYDATMQQITDLMLMNERALTMLDQVTQKLACTQVEKSMADSDTESAISELGRLGTMLAQYAKQ